ncbi:hypothetical protein CC1G_10311 [Coprinopsis cinerea okayama7|uniref:F-box domain-containing protein n=1 Tax=Coprinopsis cinerea (strain Okayama-7 / 130 / ATCC MYA-4618 / FGSC 9003) TaxID=240176 RepID=A8P0H5_COPC7|nr:hypothetical protein CC1G_10311 [Coprinopsis cinerea okayama7\|eukprot:XP_001837890.1 hypothetical protein CC1G_10311 [Coprinopsis cinerea okayama7\
MEIPFEILELIVEDFAATQSKANRKALANCSLVSPGLRRLSQSILFRDISLQRVGGSNNPNRRVQVIIPVLKANPERLCGYVRTLTVSPIINESSDTITNGDADDQLERCPLNGLAGLHFPNLTDLSLGSYDATWLAFPVPVRRWIEDLCMGMSQARLQSLSITEMRDIPPSLLLTGPSIKRLSLSGGISAFRSSDLDAFMAARPTTEQVSICQPKSLTFGPRYGRFLASLMLIDPRIFARVEDMSIYRFLTHLADIQDVNRALSVSGTSIRKLTINFVYGRGLQSLDLNPLKNLTCIVIRAIKVFPTQSQAVLPVLNQLCTLDDRAPLQSLELETSRYHRIDNWDDPACLMVRPVSHRAMDIHTWDAIDKCLAAFIRRFSTCNQIHLSFCTNVERPVTLGPDLKREEEKFESWKERAQILVVTPEELLPISSKESVLFNFTFPYGRLVSKDWR